MKRLLFLIVIAYTAIISSNAQLITWSVKPGVYDKIEPCWGDMYFVYQGNSVGVINGNGTIVVTPDASRITGFYGGYALVLKSEGIQERILGVLSGEGNYTPMSASYYTIPNQEFVSEGYITVRNSQGMAGYMNTKGVIEKQYDASFVTPFSEGYATVGEGKDFSIIDKRFSTLQFTTGSNFPINGGSAIYNGTAIIWDSNGSTFKFDVREAKNGLCDSYKDEKLKKIIKNDLMVWDYLGCLIYISNRPEFVSYENPQRSSETLTAIEQGGKYGYAKSGNTILPCQFEQAENFHGNYAIVKSNGKPALLSLHNTNEFFGAKPTNPDITYKPNDEETLSHNFRITVPSLWNVEKIITKIKDENGAFISPSNNEGLFEFQSNASEDSRKFYVELESEGLMLWSGDIEYNYTKQKPVITNNSSSNGNYKSLTVTLELANKQADRNNHCYVNATISNPNAEAVTATVTMKGSNLLEAVNNREVKIPAFGTKVVSTFFTVKLVPKSMQNVTVSTSHGGTATLDGLKLKPFD